MSRVLISAAHKSSGKTTITIGLCAAIRARNIKVQTFKKGPDYIDPMWLSKASGRPCYNLDFHTTQPDAIVATLNQHMQSADLTIIEGNKGLYDGVEVDGSNSNAALAKLTHSPIILVIDTKGVTRGIAPLVLGYQAFDKDIVIAGVILNRVGGKRHEQKLRAVMERYTNIPVLGAVYNDPQLEICERHLGLVPSNETDQVQTKIDYIAQKIADQVDIDALLSIASKAKDLPKHTPQTSTFSLTRQLTIGIIQDAAFGFYYPDDINAFKKAGANIKIINAFKDADLSDIDALFIGGGFPEVYMEKLSANQALKSSIYAAINKGLPCYAECGGLMYLSRSLTWNNKTFTMVGAIPADTVMHKTPQGRGYVQLETTKHHPWSILVGSQINAHEFHYSSLENIGDEVKYAYQITRGYGINGQYDGIIYKNTLACYTHQRNTSSNQWVKDFLQFAEQHRIAL